MPSKLDMTVPPGFQRMAAVARVLRLHSGSPAEDDVEAIVGRLVQARKRSE